MKIKLSHILSAGFSFALLTFAVHGQIATGPTFQLEKSVIASGGGTSSGPVFNVNGSGGQAATERSSGGLFEVTGGFWNVLLAPTAARVSLAGTVRTNDGSGLRNATVTITDQNGLRKETLSSTFGSFRFDDLEAGQLVVIEVRSKRFQFNSRAIFVESDVVGLVMTAIDQDERRR